MTEYIHLYGREYCADTTGHDRTWPSWANDRCPVCGEGFALSDLLAIDAENPAVIYHNDCVQDQDSK